jgi:hypothetical protein
VADLVAFIQHFVVMDDDKLLVVALWIVHTHAIDPADQTLTGDRHRDRPHRGRAGREAREGLQATTWSPYGTDISGHGMTR